MYGRGSDHPHSTAGLQGGRTAVGGRGTDVAREADVNALVATAVREFGRLDIMICNAGFGYYGTMEDTPPDVMQRMMDVNYMGTFYGGRAALPVFRAQNSGHLIFVSSIVGRRGIAFMGGYSATKAAQSGLAEALRAEFAGSPISISCVYPISTRTGFHEAMARDFGHAVSGLGPKQSVDEVARAIVKCIRRPRPEVYPHAMSRGLAVMSVVAPGFTDRFVRRFGRRRDAL
jgi:NAD(P)-dependent dehydrogenase (short-subunit alcohol dehydrogenase family)